MVKSKLQIKTTGIDHLVIWVNDLERSKRFYKDLLGMTIKIDHETTCFLWCGNQQIALFNAKANSLRPPGEVASQSEMHHVALLMEPATFEETKERLEEEGIPIRQGRAGDPDCIYIEDPDGHRVQLLYLGHD